MPQETSQFVNAVIHIPFQIPVNFPKENSAKKSPSKRNQELRGKDTF